METRVLLCTAMGARLCKGWCLQNPHTSCQNEPLHRWQTSSVSLLHLFPWIRPWSHPGMPESSIWLYLASSSASLPMWEQKGHIQHSSYGTHTLHTWCISNPSSPPNSKIPFSSCVLAKTWDEIRVSNYTIIAFLSVLCKVGEKRILRKFS